MERVQVGEAIRGYFREKRISLADVAKKFGISRPYLSLLLQGKKSFNIKLAQLWHDEYGFSQEWLMTGEGLMFGDNLSSEIIFGELIRMIKDQDEHITRLKEECAEMMGILEKTCKENGVEMPL